MAPSGASRLHVTPGLHSTALIARLLFWLLLPAILPSTSSLPLRDDGEFSNDDHHYYINDVRCLRCPAGTYVAIACTKPDTRGVCVPCPAGSYTEDLTGMSECIPCTRCRDDQDETSPCMNNKNTVCHCKKGTYCSLNQPCEICLNCTPSCPEDQFLLSPCNSTSNIQCGPQSGSSDNRTRIISIIATLLVIVVLILVVLCLKRKEGSELVKILSSVCKPDENGDSGAQLLPSHTVLQFKEGITTETKQTYIARTFDIVAEDCPVREFDKLMRKLGLNANEIERAKLEHPGHVSAQHYAMLVKWHEQNTFNVNLILNSLRRLKLDKTAEDIAKKLLEEDMYIQRPQR